MMKEKLDENEIQQVEETIEDTNKFTADSTHTLNLYKALGMNFKTNVTGFIFYCAYFLYIILWIYIIIYKHYIYDYYYYYDRN